MLRISRTIALAMAGGILLVVGTAGVTLAVTSNSSPSSSAPAATYLGRAPAATAVTQAADGLASQAVTSLTSVGASGPARRPGAARPRTPLA